MINNDKTLIYFVQSLSRPAVKPALPLKSSSEVLEASHDPLLYEDAVMLTLGEREREPMGGERECVCVVSAPDHTPLFTTHVAQDGACRLQLSLQSSMQFPVGFSASAKH